MWPQVREDQANTEQQFKTLYRSKYLPLKEEVQECRQDIARLKACRAADAEACEKWRAQVRPPARCHLLMHSPPAVRSCER